MFGTFGFQELVIILAIVLILFGGSRLPKMMGGLGEGIRNFKKSLKGSEKEDKENEKERIEETAKEDNS